MNTLPIRLFFGFCLPPLAVALTISNRNNRSCWHCIHLSISCFLLITSPPLGFVHAIWFILHEESLQRLSPQQPVVFNNIIIIPANPANVQSPSQRFHLRVTTVAAIIGIIVTIATFFSNLHAQHNKDLEIQNNPTIFQQKNHSSAPQKTNFKEH